jgi:hypothetical protein
MIDFTVVSHEFRGLVARRREVLTLLGLVFAGAGVCLENVLQGRLPEPLKALESHAFAWFSFSLLLWTSILAARVAKLHSGMMLHGILYQQLLIGQRLPEPGEPHSLRLNLRGASFYIFALSIIIAALSAALLSLSLGKSLELVGGWALLVLLVGGAFYYRQHQHAVRTAQQRIRDDRCSSVPVEVWKEHIVGSLSDTNHDMTAIVGFVGLMVFSVFQILSGLGQVRGTAELTPDALETYGPVFLPAVLVLVCCIGIFIYLRMRCYQGKFSRMLNPQDRPFRVTSVSDSLLGYVLLCISLSLSVHLLLFPLGWSETTLIAIDFGVGAFAIAVERALVWHWERHFQCCNAPNATRGDAQPMEDWERI